jgi:hypothetical protein
VNWLRWVERLPAQPIRFVKILKIRFLWKIEIEVASAQFRQHARVANVGTGTDLRSQEAAGHSPRKEWLAFADTPDSKPVAFENRGIEENCFSVRNP